MKEKPTGYRIKHKGQQINRFADRYRHEMKYFISFISTYEQRKLAEVLKRSLQLDPNAGQTGDYWIRSLYFDTPESDDYFEKVAGVYKRKKIRMRIYRSSTDDAKIEIKNRVGQYCFKESGTISRDDAEQLIKGNKEVLLKYDHPTMQNVYYYLCRDLYRPAVIVDYDREAYIGPSDDLRITFDKNIRGTTIDFDLYNHNLAVQPAFNDETIVLEVKFKEFLPSWLQDILKCHSSERFAISKYYYTRIFHYR